MTPPSAPSEGTRSVAIGPPAFANGKSGVASPKVTQDKDMELEDIDGFSAEIKLPLHEDIMQLARLGEIGPIQKLFEEGKYNATHKDGQDITPLHVRRACPNY